jgi:hypothetical protein
MPLVFALVASARLHVAAVVAPGWTLPDTLEPDFPPTIDAVLAKAPAPNESTPVARPAPKPPVRKPVSPSAVQPVVAAEAPSGISAVATPPPVEEAPLAVPPAPSAMDTASSSAGDRIVEAPAPKAANTTLPGRGRMRYIVTRGEGGFIIGESVHSWDHDGFTYRMESLTETTGLAAVFKPARIVQSSQGEVSAAGLRPREFRHERAAGIDSASFDWLRGIVAYAGRESSLAEGTQDMLSMYYQLVLLAPRSGTVEMAIATGRKLAKYRFEVLGEETLDFPSGERQTVRVRTRSGNDNIEMWLPIGAGEQAHGMPLKIRIIDRKGDIYDQIADDLSSTETKWP